MVWFEVFRHLGESPFRWWAPARVHDVDVFQFKVPFGLGFRMFEGLHGSEGSKSACLINAGAYGDPPR